MSKAASRIPFLLVLGLALAGGGCGGSSAGKTAAPAATGGLVSIGAGFQGLPGLKATVYARGIPQMSAFAFDSRGRLWVTRSGATTHEGDGVYLVAGPGAKPVKVIPAALKGPLGLVWVGKALRQLARARHGVHWAEPGATSAGRRRSSPGRWRAARTTTSSARPTEAC